MAKKPTATGPAPKVAKPRQSLGPAKGDEAAADPLVSYIRNRPYEATLLTLAGGMLLGLLIGLRR